MRLTKSRYIVIYTMGNFQLIRLRQFKIVIFINLNVLSDTYNKGYLNLIFYDGKSRTYDDMKIV